MPQAPQFCVSVARSAQASPQHWPAAPSSARQLDCPEQMEPTQAPFTHRVPCGQDAKHACGRSARH